MTLDDSVHAFRLRLMTRAQVLGNVSKVCREFGISRCLFYRWRKRYLAYGPDGLHPRRTGARPGRPPLLSVQAERAILALAITWPTRGPLQLALQLALPEHGSWHVAPSTVYRLLRRSGQKTRWGPPLGGARSPQRSRAAVPLTERTRRQLAATQRRQAPEVYPALLLGITAARYSGFRTDVDSGTETGGCSILKSMYAYLLRE